MILASQPSFCNQYTSTGDPPHPTPLHIPRHPKRHPHDTANRAVTYGVYTFGIKDGVRMHLDRSLREFDTVYPAGGDDHSAVRLTPDKPYGSTQYASAQ